jgi:hypothetical protein
MPSPVPLRATLAGLALVAASSGLHAQLADNTPGNLVTNGSMTFITGGLDAWSFLHPGGEYWNSFQGQSSPDGGTYLGVQDLDNFAPRFNVGGIAQTISGLTAGADYQLTFYSMTNHDGVGLQDWQVTFGNDTLTGLQTAPKADQTGNWVQSTMSFTASAGTETLTFMAQYLPGSVPEMLNLDGVVLRQVSDAPPVAAVPEPETYALFGIGLLLLRVAARRQRAKEKARAGA